MNTLEHLGLALGLASLAGINLYLTVLLAGSLIHWNLLHLAEKHQELAILAHPTVLTIASVLFAIEFIADKVPWVDSAWDSIHTLIRPLGGTLLSMQALGHFSPEMQLALGLLAGGAALTTHTAKAGTRLLVNHSPEPVSNVAISFTEDLGVMAGVALIAANPIIAFVTFVAVLSMLWIIIPKLYRALKGSFSYLWQKLRKVVSGYQSKKSTAPVST
jgi:hypothetical protein